MKKALLLTVTASLCIGAVGCARELEPSPCTDEDDLAARTLVYRSDGVPFYAGQALVTSSCAGDGSFCHTPNPSTAYGAPADLNFNVGVACSDATSGCADALTALSVAQRDVVDWRRHIMAEVESETMPPGEAGQEVLSAAMTYRLGPLATDSPLPGLDTTEGQAILEHWLACGAPVVERTIAPGVLMAGDNCTCVGASCDIVPAAVVGDCIVRSEVMIEPTWASIYDNVISTCGGGSCHDAGANVPDLSSRSASYTALINQPAASGCSATTLDYVEPNDPMQSVLYLILTDDSACPIGRMPLARDPLDSDVTDVIAEWISAGAEDN